MIGFIRYPLSNWSFLLRRAIIALILAGLALYTFYPWIPGTQGAAPRTIVVYGFSILGDTLDKGIFPAFQDEWKARTGEHVEFVSSFSGSGTVTNQLILGVPAQVAILALELDAQKLVDKGVLRSATWRQLSHNGVLNRTPFIIIVRSGNPKGIKDFADLAKAGIGVVHPDPLTSGGAQWALLAEYGSALRMTKDKEQAFRQLFGIWKNVVAQAASARAARTQFDNGFGDALITYEQEAAYDRSRGKLKADVVYPRSTVFSEHTVVVIDKNIKPDERDLVQAFVDFLWSDQAQAIFVKYGFRSFDERLNSTNPYFGQISDAFSVSDFGGWSQVKHGIVDAIWKNQVLAALGK